MIAATSAIEEVSRTVGVRTRNGRLVWSEGENIVNAKVSVGFTRHNETGSDKAVLTVADGEAEAEAEAGGGERGNTLHK